MPTSQAKPQNQIASGIDREFFFSSPRYTVAGRDLQRVQLPQNASTDAIAQTVRDVIGRLRSAPQAVVLGAFPFAPTSAGALFIPQHLTINPTARSTAAASIPVPERRFPVSVREVPPAEIFENSVMEALRRLSRNEMEKIVLARALDLELAEPVNIGDLLQILLYRNPTGFTYSVPLELALQRPPHLFIGASPELLVQRLAGKVTANPLAGSAPRSQEPEEDRANADALVRSEKDLREHAVVVTAVRKTLERYCSNLVVSDAPAVLATPTMWHLSTTMTGQLADPSVNALDSRSHSIQLPPFVGARRIKHARQSPKLNLSSAASMRGLSDGCLLRETVSGRSPFVAPRSKSVGCASSPVPGSSGRHAQRASCLRQQASYTLYSMLLA